MKMKTTLTNRQRKIGNTSTKTQENETPRDETRDETVPIEMRTTIRRGGAEKNRHGASGRGAGRAVAEPPVNGCEPPAHLLGT